MLRNLHKTQIRDVHSGINRNYMSRENFIVRADNDSTDEFPEPKGDDWTQEDIDALKKYILFEDGDINNGDIFYNCVIDEIKLQFPTYTRFYDYYNYYKNVENPDEKIEFLLFFSSRMVGCILSNIKSVLTQSQDWIETNETQLKYILKIMIIYDNLSKRTNFNDKTINCIVQNIKTKYPNYSDFYNSLTNDISTNIVLFATIMDKCENPQPPTPQPPTPSSNTDNKNNTLLIIGIIIGSLVLLALIIFFILHRQ